MNEHKRRSGMSTEAGRRYSYAKGAKKTNKPLESIGSTKSLNSDTVVTHKLFS